MDCWKAAGRRKKRKSTGRARAVGIQRRGVAAARLGAARYGNWIAILTRWRKAPRPFRDASVVETAAAVRRRSFACLVGSFQTSCGPETSWDAGTELPRVLDARHRSIFDFHQKKKVNKGRFRRRWRRDANDTAAMIFHIGGEIVLGAVLQ